MNGQYASAVYDPAMKNIIASATNARYDEIIYSSFEGNNLKDKPEITWVVGVSGPYKYDQSHTGEYCYKLPNSPAAAICELQQGTNLLPNKKYKASIWVYMPNEAETDGIEGGVRFFANSAAIDYVSPDPSKKAGSWYLM